MTLLRAVLGLRPLPEEPPISALKPYSLDGGATFLTTRQWVDLLGITRQGVHRA